MGFIILTATPSSAVATNGTIAFTFANGLQGMVQYEGNHVLFSEGLQASFSFPAGFTLGTWGATGVTVTYLGTTSIPAGTAVKLQLEAPGENNYLTTAFPPVDTINWMSNGVKVPRAALGRVYRVLVGAPAAASTTAVANAVNGQTNGAALVALSPAYYPDVPRNLQVVSSGAGDTTQTVTLRGLDEYGAAMTEVLTLNGTSAVLGKKAFAQVNSWQLSAALASTNTLSIGTGVKFGLPFFLSGGTGAGSGGVVKESADGATATAGTFVGGDLSAATGTTGDVRGTWTTNTAPNGTHYYEALVYASDLTFKGNPQYAG